MRILYGALFTFLVALIAVFNGSPGTDHPSPAFAQEPDGSDDAAEEFVVVQREPTGPSVFAQRDEPPSLEELGYESVPVPDGMTADEYLAQLNNDPSIRSAVPDARVYAAATPNDPYYTGSQRDYLQSIGVPAAWDLATGREQVIVAVLDSGIDLAHPDLAPRLWTNPNEVPGNNQDDDGNLCIDDVHGCRFVTVDTANQGLCGYQPRDGVASGNIQDDNGQPGSANHSHGTMTSGIIGAAGNNGQGIAGIGWNVQLMPIKVLDCGGFGRAPVGRMFDVARGIDYARRMGADIINLSLAARPGDPGADSPAVRDAIAAAEAQGIIIVAAAGNWGDQSDPRPGYPAAYTQYSNVVAVGASDWTKGHTWAEYSAWGAGLDFAAPGNQIASTVRTDLGIAAPYMKSQGGTSFSAPLVSGMFALMMSANSRLGHETYIDIARQTATPAPPAPHGGDWAGSGIINVRAAVERIPLLVTGSALHDWLDVPAGTQVDAHINGTRCGTTTTHSIGVIARFELFVDPAAIKFGCGAPGRMIQFTVNGAPADTTLVWGGPTQELVYTGQEISSVSPPPGPIVVQDLQPGWNNLGHFEDNTDIPAAFTYLPPLWRAVFWWDAEAGRYQRAIQDAPAYAQDWPAVNQYDAYWAYISGPGTAASINPLPDPGREVQLEAGWNNFVYTGTSQEMSQVLESLGGAYDAVYHFDNAVGEWRSYVPGRPRYFNTVGGLLTSKVYWIHMTAPATLVMN